MIDIQSDIVIKKKSFKSAIVFFKVFKTSVIPLAKYTTSNNTTIQITLYDGGQIFLANVLGAQPQSWHCLVYTKESEIPQTSTQKQQVNVIKDDLPILHYFCTYNTNPEFTSSSCIIYQQLKQFTKLQSKQKTRLWKEPFCFRIFQGKE